jgi:hypothetical protein
MYNAHRWKKLLRSYIMDRSQDALGAVVVLRSACTPAPSLWEVCCCCCCSSLRRRLLLQLLSLSPSA